MWNPFRPRPCTICRDIRRDLEDVRLDLEHLQAQFEKWRGRNTGGRRKRDDADPGIDPVSAMILARRAQLHGDGKGE